MRSGARFDEQERGESIAEFANSRSEYQQQSKQMGSSGAAFSSLRHAEVINVLFYKQICC